MLTHKSNQSLLLDGNFGLYQQNDIFLSLYVNSKLDQSETKRDFTNKLHLRVHHQDDKIFSIGVEGWNPLKSTAPNVISASALIGKQVEGWRPYVGVSTAFKISSSSLSFHRYLIGLKQRQYTAYLEFNVDSKVRDVKNEKTGIITKEDYWGKAVNVVCDWRVNPDLKVAKDLKWNVDTGALAYGCVAEYRLDADTFVKGKFSSDNSVTLSLTHNYRGLLNFGVVTRVFYLLIF